MPDVYATIADADHAIQERLAAILELRAADPQQRAILDGFLAAIAFPPGARVLEIGCGTGPVTRTVAGLPEVGDAVGIDPSPVFIAKARESATALDNVTFEEGDGRALRFADGDLDIVIFNTAWGTSRSRSRRWPKRGVSCVRAGSSPSATRITPRPAWPS